jgi:hypothetical protein
MENLQSFGRSRFVLTTWLINVADFGVAPPDFVLTLPKPLQLRPA